MKQILIATDSFKGSMSSLEAASAIEEGFRRIFPMLTAIKVPIADGGEGTLEAILEGMHGQKHTIDVTGPLGAPLMASFGIVEGNVAIIEMAEALGAKFFDENGISIVRGGLGLSKIAMIDMSEFDQRIYDSEITVLSDVDNPLCGKNGASFVYGPPKGSE